MGKINKRKSTASRKPLVSIVIPAYNEESVIGRLIESIKRQTYKNVETIVVDDASNDKTADIAENLGARVYRRKHAERSIQRNFGAGKAKGKYLFFPDSDMELAEGVVAECVELAQKDAKIGAIAIPEESVATNFWEEVKAFERSFYNLEGDDVTDAARFFPKEVFKKAGGYDESITGPEDWDLPDSIRKLGYKVGRIQPLIYHYERIKSPWVVARKKYYYALKSHRYVTKHNLPTFGPKTVYFLRPVFYKHWKRLLMRPVLSLGMLFVMNLELTYGAVGYFVGKFSNK